MKGNALVINCLGNYYILEDQTLRKIIYADVTAINTFFSLLMVQLLKELTYKHINYIFKDGYYI